MNTGQRTGPALALAALLTIGCYATWSSPIHPSAQGHHAELDNRPHQNAQGKAEEHNGEGDASLWIKTEKDPLAVYTLLLVIFTAVLAGVSGFQIYFLSRADKTARISADAAKTSADAATAAVKSAAQTDPAVLTVVIVSHTFGEATYRIIPPTNNGVSVTPISDILYVIRNYGNTAAVIRKVSNVIEMKTSAPSSASLKPYLYPITEYTIAPGGSLADRLRCGLSRPLMHEEATSIRSGTTWLWFCGQIIFDDIFGVTWQHTFVWQYDGTSGVLRHCYTPNHTTKVQSGADQA